MSNSTIKRLILQVNKLSVTETVAVWLTPLQFFVLFAPQIPVLIQKKTRLGCVRKKEKKSVCNTNKIDERWYMYKNRNGQ